MHHIVLILALTTAAASGGPGPAPGPPAEHDLAVIGIDVPAGPHVPPGMPLTPAITIRNAGMYPEAGFMLHFSVSDSGGAVVHADSLAVADTLPPDSVRQHAFAVPFTPLPEMNYLATAAAVLDGDGFPADDTLRRAFSTFEFHDLSVVSIDTPAAFVVAPGVPLTPAATIRNGGTFGETGFKAHYLIADTLAAVVYHDSVTVTALAASADTLLGFAPFTPEPLTAYRACAFTALAGDSLPGNDTAELGFRTFEYGGAVSGTVRDENAGNTPLANAVVSAASAGESFTDTTDAAGGYRFPFLPAGAYDLRAGKDGYVDSTVQDLAVASGAAVALDFSLGYPSLALTPPDSIPVLLPPGGADSSRWLVLWNTGTRDAACELVWPERASKALGDSVWGADVESMTSDNLCLGVEFDGTNLWVTGAAGSPSSDPNYLYRLDRQGNLLASHPQPPGTGWGWRDLCWDGQFLYGASDSAILQIDTAGGGTTGVRIPGPCAVARGLAHDPGSDHFFVADFADSIYEIDRSGAVVNAWGNGGSVFGLAWDAAPDGPWLWTSSTDTSGGTPRPFLRQFDPRNGVYTGLLLVPGTIDPANAAAGGLAFSTTFSGGRGTLIALIQDDRDRLVAYDIRPENARWLALSRASLALAPSQRDSVRLTFGSTGLDSTRDYSAWVTATSGVPGRADSALAILRSPYGVAGGRIPAAGGRFALLPCRPNPARVRAVIIFSLPRAGRAELAVYNVAGQRVRTLVSGDTPAGWHSAAWDVRDDRGQRVASGVYISRLRADGRQRTNKVTILR